MRLDLQNLALLAAIIIAPALADATTEGLSISDLITKAKAARLQGNNADALSYFDAAVKRDPSDYMNVFQRGATYLSLGRNGQAKTDFDSVLKIRPGFEGALTQRAKIYARNGEWALAERDYTRVGKKGEDDLADVQVAAGAAIMAMDAEKTGKYEDCVIHAGAAITVAGTSLSLRKLRAKCRLERGEVQEGVSDLQHVLQMHPGDLEPHVQVSSMLFYSLADTDRGLSQVKKCLQSDPDYKACKALHREEKSIVRAIEKVNTLLEKKQYASASKLLVGNPSEEDPGLLAEVIQNVASGREAGYVHAKAGSELYTQLVDKTCECYVGMNNHKKAAPYCKEALELNPTSLYGLLHIAQQQLDAENYDAAIGTLNTAKDNHQENRQVQEKLQEAQTLLKRSKNKDYYKIIGVSRDADEATIKKAYRKATKEFHPDKAIGRGVSKEDAERKMAGINEAYEVLSDPELKARFDRGDDPNDQSQQGGRGNPFQGGPGGQQFVFRQGGSQFHFQGNPFGGSGGGGGGGNPFGGFPFG